ncbi:hypothetical protein Pcinc_038716 [Petrolisthes cinctipes]|uniref:Uncharacterized protein n=1 Tax=Petrolisthes cinctipes TaxID=88211 RepID=A0AAE1BT27_PETCI|nr:hypothetical protein Pcinc_038716 [Petrolisthes cinctipes]
MVSTAPDGEEASGEKEVNFRDGKLIHVNLTQSSPGREEGVGGGSGRIHDGGRSHDGGGRSGDNGGGGVRGEGRWQETPPRPYFASLTPANLSIISGQTGYLPCRVHMLGDRSVRTEEVTVEEEEECRRRVGWG